VIPFWWPRRGTTPTRKLDERFTDIADRVSEEAGRWYTTAISLLLFAGWIALGPRMAWSDTWQLIANTPTTWVELWLGLFMLAAANRVEKRNRELHEAMAKIIGHIEQLTAREGQELDQIVSAMHLPQPPEGDL
jgi:low affinity Fe/Cu permease